MASPTNPNQTPDIKPCETCGSLGWLHDPKGHFEEGDANPKFTVDCPTCHGTGTVEPQPASDSGDDELTRILTDFAKVFAMPHRAGKEVMSWWGHDTDLGDCLGEFAEARAAIIKLIEEIIGEDEMLKDWLYLDKTTQGLYIARNALRAKQRQRLKGGTDGKTDGK